VGSALVIVGLALVLALQIAIHLRLAGIPARIATLKLVTEDRARPDADAFQEALARKLNLILRGIQGYHDQIAEDFRAQVAAGEQRVRLAERQRADAVGVASELRTLAREMAGIVAELRGLQGDFAELVCAAAEARSPLPQAAPPAPKEEVATAVPDDPDERKTVEMPPPASCAPPAACAASTDPPAERRPKLPNAAADERPDDAGWDDPEEKTKLFAKEAAPAVLVTPPSPELRVVDGPPSGGSGLRVAARSARHALRPPPPAHTEGDDAVERPSILPDPRERGSGS
jgi:hypothetical protein